MKIECAHDELKDLDLLVPNPKNPNKHPPEQIKLLAKIMKHQGWRSPIVVSTRSGFITKGHGRLEAARLNKWTQAPVDLQDYASEADEYADMVADNKIAELAETDMSMVLQDVLDLGPDFDFDLLGIPDFKLPEDFEPGCDEDAIPEHVEPKTKLGDLYQLGSHRLMCGDATRIDVIEKLMNGEKADLWLTDPPYGVGMEAREKSSNGAWVNKKRVSGKITNDDKPLDQMKIFWRDVAASAYAATTDKASYLWFACQGGDQMMMMMMMSLGEAAWQVKHELIWVKDQMVFGRCDYHYKHEPILYGWKREESHEWFGDRKQTSVLEFARPKSSELHPTMKPIELLESLLNNHSGPGQKILDTFGGSGSTMIACHKTGRDAYLCEIDPHYCDVIVARWEKYTGKKATLNGQTQA